MKVQLLSSIFVALTLSSSCTTTSSETQTPDEALREYFNITEEDEDNDTEDTAELTSHQEAVDHYFEKTDPKNQEAKPSH